VRVVPKEDAAALADAIGDALGQPRRTRPSTGDAIERRFRADAVARQYWDVYADVTPAARR